MGGRGDILFILSLSSLVSLFPSSTVAHLSSLCAKVDHELIKIPKPICRVPMLAVHLARGSGTKLEINKEEHLSAVLSTRVFDQVNASKSSEKSGGEGDESDDKAAAIAGSMEDNHCPVLLELVAKELGCDVGDILDFELQLCDTQPSALGGAHDE